jgi:hypothetical protein
MMQSCTASECFHAPAYHVRYFLKTKQFAVRGMPQLSVSMLPNHLPRNTFYLVSLPFLFLLPQGIRAIAAPSKVFQVLSTAIKYSTVLLCHFKHFTLFVPKTTFSLLGGLCSNHDRLLPAL